MSGKALFMSAVLGVMLTHTALADIRHIVAFRYRSGVDETTKADIAQRFFQLKDRALKDGKPYIVSIVGGKPLSKEGFDQRFEQVFIVTFRTAADRDYFVGPPYRKTMDPVHEASAKRVIPLIEADAAGTPIGLFVFDFEDGGSH